MKNGPITKKQLIEFFKDYREAFPDWQVEHDVVLTRINGAVKQHMAFEALRDGAYRPSCSVEILVASDVRILQHFLDIKNREILPREHQNKWPNVVRAMEQQFQPSIRKPLDVMTVLSLGEAAVVRDKITNLNYFSALAALNAFVGNSERGLYWCDRIQNQIKQLGREPAAWEYKQSEYASQLREAIITKSEKTFLNAILKNEE